MLGQNAQLVVRRYVCPQLKLPTNRPAFQCLVDVKLHCVDAWVEVDHAAAAIGDDRQFTRGRVFKPGFKLLLGWCSRFFGQLLEARIKGRPNRSATPFQLSNR